MLHEEGARMGEDSSKSQQQRMWTRSSAQPHAGHLAILVEGAHIAGSSSPSTLSLSLCSNELSVYGVRASVARSLGVCESAFHLLHATQLLREGHLTSALAGADPPLMLRLLYRNCLVGGKGGFGTLLRSSTTKVGAKKTSNFSASRDLSGRRMRHVEAEKQIAEWNSQHHEPVSQAELSAKYKAIKEGRSDLKPCKWGATCKYRDTTCRNSHPPDPNASADQSGPQSSMPAEIALSDPPKAVSKRHMKDAVAAGLLSTRKRARAADEERKSGDDEDDEDDEEEDQQYSSSEDDRQPDDDEPAPKRFHHEDLPSAVPTAPAAAAAASSSSSFSSADELLPFGGASAASSVFATPYAPAAPAYPSFSVHPRESQLASVEPVKAGQGLAAVLAKVKKQTNKQQAAAAAAAVEAAAASSSSDAPVAAAAAASSSAPAAPAATAAASFDPIDLSSVESVDALAAYPVAHLTFELTRVGLKAGGTQRQKAERLFLLKDTTIDKLPAKVRATPPAVTTASA